MSALPANPLLSEIRRLYQNEESGILSLRGASGQRVEISFREGVIEAASSNLVARRLGDYLAEDGYATARELDALESAALRQKISIGEAAVRKGLLSPPKVGMLARRQVTELLDQAFKNEFAVDSFKTNLRSYYAPAMISFPNVLLELCRNNAVPFEAKNGRPMVLSGGANLGVFDWYPEELHVLGELRHPNTFGRLSKTVGFEDTVLKRILGVVDGLGILEFPDGSVDETEQSGALVRNSDFPFEQLVPVVTNALLHEKVEVVKNETSFTSEQFKTLKIQIMEANRTASLKVLTVSSPDMQDGKSLLAVNLAFAFAMDSAQRVIIIDCDLRCPSLDNYLGVPTKPGLLQYLANGHVRPHCYMRRMQNLYFLTTGGIAANSIEILSRNKMKQLVEHLKKDFDTIILDAPPYCPIADARIVTGLSDGLLMVVRRGKTSYGSVDQAFRAVDRNKLLGIVFNDVKPLPFHTYYNFGYYYYGNRQRNLYTTISKAPKTPRNYLESKSALLTDDNDR